MYNYQLDQLIEAIYDAQGLSVPRSPQVSDMQSVRKEAERAFLATDTREQLARVASELIATWPQFAFPVVRDVTLIRKGRQDDLVGRAEVYRVWPLPHTYEVRTKEGTERAHIGVAASGRAIVIAATPGTPNMVFDDQLSWQDVPDANVVQRAWQYRAHVDLVATLDGLKARCEPTQPYVALPTAGAPLGRTDLIRANDLFDKACALMWEFQRHHERYGSRSKPVVQGEPTRVALTAWKQCDEVVSTLRKIDKKLDKLGYTDRRPWHRVYSE